MKPSRETQPEWFYKTDQVWVRIVRPDIGGDIVQVAHTRPPLLNVRTHVYRSQLQAACERHANMDDEYYFLWPSTAVLNSKEALDRDHFHYQDGLMSFLGYHVGKTKPVPWSKRKTILDYVYNEVLPNVNNPKYMQEWGEPKTGPRLEKLADFLAAKTRTEKSNEASTGYDYSVAIEQREHDLGYLKVKYYDGQYDRSDRFEWPTE
jgi:hypothetical protein